MTPQPKENTKIFKYINGTASDVSQNLIKSLKTKLPFLIKDKGLIYVLDTLNRSLSEKKLFKNSNETHSRIRLEKLKNKLYGDFTSNDGISTEFTRLNKKFNTQSFVFLKPEFSIKIIKKAEELVKKLLDMTYSQDTNPDEILIITLIIHNILNTSHPYQDGNGRTLLAFTKTFFEILQTKFELDLSLLDQLNKEYNSEMQWCTLNSFPDTLLLDLWQSDDQVIDYVQLCYNPTFDLHYNGSLTYQLIKILKSLGDVIDEKYSLTEYEGMYPFFYDGIKDLKTVIERALVVKK